MKRDLKCRIGDLAIVVDAFNKVNLGKIVQVVDTHSQDKVPWLDEPGDHYDWIVECPSHLMWSNDDGAVWRRQRGPAPDFALHPIRGLGAPPKERIPVPVQEREEIPVAA